VGGSNGTTLFLILTNSLELANLENLNAHLIKEGVGHDERLLKLNEVAIYQLDLLSNTKSVEYLKSLPKKVK
jgi:hypothetical protein